MDMDSYFASVEQQANPDLRGRPIVVTGKPTIKSVVAAASREAKKYGIRSAMSTWEAEEKCSELVLVPGSPDRYEWTTERFLEILRRYTSRLEMFGVDEVFMEMTSPLDGLREAVETARQIQREVETELGEFITCSVGIARNKLLAKLASDLKKPEGVRLIREKEVPDLLSSTPMTELCGIGSRTERRLNRLGIDNLPELARASEEMLREEFGVRGPRLKRMAKGRDPSPVVPERYEDPVKSVGHSLTLPDHKRIPEKAMPVLFKLCQQVGYRLRSHDLMGKTVKLYLRDEDLEVSGKQRTLGRYTDDGNRIYCACQKIEDRMEFPPTPTMVGVRVSSLKDEGKVTKSIFPERRKREELLRLMDSINEEYGEGTIRFAARLGADDLVPFTSSFRGRGG